MRKGYKCSCQLGFNFAKRLSMAPANWVWIIAGIFALVMLVCVLFATTCIGKFFSDMLSPVSMRNFVYHGKNEESLGFLSVLAYGLGVILLSGVLIPVVTNFLRKTGERYITGTRDKYNWKGHTLFLGYDDMMIQTLKEVLGTDTEATVVVAVPDHVLEVRSKLGGVLLDEELARVEVVQCNMCDKMELTKRACVNEAARVFLIGQPDDPTHDANNFKSLDVLSEIIDSKTQSDKGQSDKAQSDKGQSDKGQSDKTKADKALPEVYLYIRNRASFSLIQRQGYVRENNSNLHKKTNPFNFYENIAGNLLTGFYRNVELMKLDYHSSCKNLAVCPERDVHLVILGMTEMGMALAREVLMVAHYPGHKVKITLVDENAREQMFFFTGRYKDLFKLCRYTFQDLDGVETAPDQTTIEEEILDVSFEFIKGSVAHPELMKMLESWAGDEKQLLTLAICTNDSPRNMAVALYLPRTLVEGENAVPVWVYQQGDDSLKEFMSHHFYKRLRTFSPREYGSLSLCGSLAVKWAEEVGRAYEQSSMKSNKGKTWEGMTQYERWSSLYNVRSIIAKLRGLGYELQMDDKGDKKIGITCFSTDPSTHCPSLDLEYPQMVALGRTEHIRWMVDTLTKGFRPTTEAEHAKVLSDTKLKDHLKKTIFAHDDIRPFDQLSPQTAKYDIDMTQAMINAINAKVKKV